MTKKAYKPWLEYIENRHALEQSYLQLRKLEDAMHNINDFTFSQASVDAYKRQVEPLVARAEELKAKMDANSDIVKAYTGKEINSDNQYDSFRKSVRNVIYGAAAGLAGYIGFNMLFYGKAAANLMGLDNKSVKLSQAEEKNKALKQRDITRRGILEKVLPRLKENKQNYKGDAK